MAFSIGDLSVGFVLDQKQLDAMVSQVEKRFTGLGSTLIGASGLLTLSRTIFNVGKDILSTSSEFSSKLQRTYAIMGEVSAEAAADIRREALRIGEASSFSATEVADAMQTLSMAGWKPDAILSGTEALVRMAEVAGTKDVGRVAGIVTSTLGAFQKDASHASELANILTVTATNTNTTVLGLGEAMSYAANKAGALGFSMSDTAMMLGLFGNMGMQGSRAGTTLMQVINGLSGTTAKNKQALAMLGEDFSLFDEATGKAKPLVQVLGQIRDKAKGWDDATRTSFAQMLGGTRGANGVLAILNTTDKTWEHMIGLYEDIPTDMATSTAKNMLTTLSGAIVYMQSALDTLKINLGSTLEEPLMEAVKLATGVVNTLNKMDETDFAGAMKLIGLISAGMGVKGLGMLIKFIPTLAKAFVGLTGPMGLVSIGIIAITAAVIDADNEIGKFLEHSAEEFVHLAEDWDTALRDMYPVIGKRMTNFLNSLSNTISIGAPSLVNLLVTALTSVSDWITGQTPEIVNVGQTIITSIADSIAANAPRIITSGFRLIHNLALGMLLSVPTLVGSALNLASSIWDAIVNYDWKTAGSAVNKGIGTAFTNLGDVVGKWLFGENGYNPDTVTWNAVGKKIIEKLNTALKDASGSLRDFVGGLILGDSYRKTDKIDVFASKLINKIFDTAEDGVDGAADFVQGIIEGIAEMFSEANIANASTALQGVIRRILERVAGLIANLGSNAADIITAIGTALFGTGNDDGIVSVGVSALSDLVETILSVLVTDIIPNLGTAAAGILTAIAGVLFGENGEDGAAAVGVNALTDLVTDIFTTLNTQVIPTLGSVVANIFTSISNLISNPNNTVAIGRALGDLFASIITGIAGFIDSLYTEYADLADSVDIEGESSSVIEGIKAFAESIINAIAQAIPTLAHAGTTILTALAGMFADFHIEDWISGAFDLADALITAIGTAFNQAFGNGNEGKLGSSIGTFVGSLVTAIATGIQKLPELVENATSVGMQLLNTLLTELSAAFESAESSGMWSSLGSAAATLVQSILTAITTIIADLPSFLDGAANVGMQIVNGIMEAISTFLGNLEDGEFGRQFGTAIFDLVHNILTGISNLGTDEDFQTFFQNLCNGMVAALGTLGNIFGQVLSDIVRYIFSGDAITDLFNAGRSIIDIIIQGMRAAVGGVSGFFFNMLDEILIGLGLIDTEAAERYREQSQLGDSLMSTAEEMFADFGADYDNEKGRNSDEFVNMALLAMFGFSDGRDFANRVGIMGKDFLTEADSVVQNLNHGYLGFADFSQNMWAELENENLNMGGQITPAKVKEIASRYFGYLGISDLPDEVYGQMANYVAHGGLDNENSMWNLLLSTVFGYDPDGITADVTGEVNVADVARNAGVEVAEDITGAAQEGAEEGAAPIDWSQTGAFGEEGIAQGIAQAGEKVAESAATVSREAVAQFVQTMSTEEGVTIGSYFAAGIATGILSGLPAIIAAATLVANAAVDAMNKALEISSPSDVTKDTGYWFDRGFAKGIDENALRVSHSAKALGVMADETLGYAYSTREVGADGLYTETNHARLDWGSGYDDLLSLIAGDMSRLVRVAGDVASEASDELNNTEQTTTNRRSGGGGGGTQTTQNQSYVDFSQINFDTVRVQGMDDIQQLAAEIAAARRRKSFGYGS